MRSCSCFLWGGQDGMREFLRGMRLGEMPSEMRAPVFVMEALQVGSFDDLSAVSGGVRADARRFISEHYPYVGVDLADETFEAHGFDVAQVMRLASRLIRLAESQLPLRAMLFLRRSPACSLLVEWGRAHAKSCR